MQQGPWQIILFLGVAALVVLPFAAFLLRQACSIFGEGMPDYRRAIVVVLVSAGGAYLSWDGASFAMVKMAKDNNIDLSDLTVNETVDLTAIFHYINALQIELYDFNNIQMDSVDITKREDIERFVLTHVYYITQHA